MNLDVLVDADELIGWGIGLGFEGEERWGKSPLEAALKDYLLANLRLIHGA